ncbi:CHASE2 domain-containing protein [Mucisphaera sp.]|uniref:CHASE2 domain-containing protein n=1 Tax=Mucisphaera sp. TaxID=2913024 RepID=UPI003D0D20C0
MAKRRARIQSGRAWGTFVVSVLVGLLVVGVDVVDERFWGPLERYNYDLLLQMRGEVPAVDDRLVLLGLDNRIEAFFEGVRENWEDEDYAGLLGVDEPPADDAQLLRLAHGYLMETLGDLGASAVVWDVAFDRLTGRTERGLEAASAADGVMARGLAAVPSYLAVEGRLVSEREDALIARLGRATAGVRNPSLERLALIEQMAVGSQADVADVWPVPFFRIGDLRPHPFFAERADGGGHVAYTLEPDGVVRRTPVLTFANNRLFPSLPFAAVLRALDPTGEGLLKRRIRLSDDGYVLPIGADREVVIPVDHEGRMWINLIPDWLERVQYQSYYTTWESLAQFPEDFEETFRGKIVLIGETATFTNDLVTTPLDFDLPGAMVLYNVMNTVLTEQFISPVPRWVVTGLTVSLTLLLGGVYLLRSAWLSIVVTATVMVGLLVASPALFYVGSTVFLPVALPLLAVVLAASVATLAALGRAYRWATRLSTILSRFVSPALLEELYRHGVTRQSLAPVREEITILFVDIAGFTSLTDVTEPEEISEFLTVWYEEAMAILVENHGTLDKFLGDGVLAYFGAPEPLEDKAVWAVRAALALQARFDEISGKLSRSRKRLKIRAGLCTGYATIGYLGGDRFAAYTILGRPVNMAARLEQNCRPGSVTIEKKTWAHVDGRFEMEELEPIHAKGIERPIEAWKVVRELGPDERFGEDLGDES